MFYQRNTLTPLYTRALMQKRRYLYYHDGHFDVITKMTAFLGRNYYCTDCDKGYEHKGKHSCYNVCHHCFKIHDFQEEQWQYCEDCNRHFINGTCFGMHKQCSFSDQSTCNTY
jgi:hypothetical protein